MAYFSISNIQINGIAAAVPKNSVSNFSLEDFEKDELNKLIDTIGIENRRVSVHNQCASDLCIEAANKLIIDLGWNKNEIDCLFFVTQTPDFHLPGTALNIQHRLGLSKSCAAFDINQGCAGYVYGLSLIASFMSSSGLKKGLLLVGDTITKLVSPLDKSLLPVFSDCGTATAISFNSEASKMYFNITSEGESFESIIVPDSGFKNQASEESFNYCEIAPGIQRQGIHLAMKGLEVLNFSLKKVAPHIDGLLQNFELNKNSLDYFVLHQANKLILESIGAKLNVPLNKLPSSLKEFGNTSCATIPLTIVTYAKINSNIIDSKLVLSGFGVGLSLGSAVVEFNNIICSDLIEI